MNTSAFSFHLPSEQIAQYPSAERDASRLLSMDRKTGAVSHGKFFNVVGKFSSGDVLVLNQTKVIPARMYAKRETGGHVEILLHKKISGDVWEVLIKPGKRIRPEETLRVEGLKKIYAMILDKKEDGKFQARFPDVNDDQLFECGKIPLPPYIRREPVEKDCETYQTVYAKIPGSVAAPTAGLHFTEKIFRDIRAAGVKVCFVTLHVGLGTFRPVQTEKIENHSVESEWAEIKEDTCGAINQAKKNGGKIWAVGTTTVRTLEKFCDKNGLCVPQKGMNDLFIYPPYEFKVIDRLLTNFHLPQSSLLALVCAFGGYENVMNAYQEAVVSHYRFYSYGDAMCVC